VDKRRFFSEIKRAADKSGLDFREALISLSSCRSLLGEYGSVVVDEGAAGREVCRRAKSVMREEKLSLKAAVKQVLPADPILAELYHTAPRTQVEC